MSLARRRQWAERSPVSRIFARKSSQPMLGKRSPSRRGTDQHTIGAVGDHAVSRLGIRSLPANHHSRAWYRAESAWNHAPQRSRFPGAVRRSGYRRRSDPATRRTGACPRVSLRRHRIAVTSDHNLLACLRPREKTRELRLGLMDGHHHRRRFRVHLA